VWVDITKGAPPTITMSAKEVQGIRRYAGGTWGAWYRMNDLTKKKK
jgi:hypothetical protein